MSLFGTSGIRGKANTIVTNQLSLQIGQALAVGTKAKAILTAHDTRTTSPMLYCALTAGIAACGTTVLQQGIIPTPALAYLTKQTRANVGVMITASHNPPEYNGIKPFNPDTTAFSRVQQNQIERLVKQHKFKPATWQNIGKITRIDETHQYVEMITGTVRLKKPWKIVLDLGNGAASRLAPRIFRELDCKVTTLNAQPDGHFPGRGADPNEKSLKPLCSVVRKLQADIGIALDGDGDRMVTIDERGHMASLDQTFAAFAAHKIRQQQNGIVVTHVEASMCIEETVKKEGGEVARTKVGDVSIAEAMKKHKAIFGGEPCGAWIHPNYHYCPDGILSSILLLQALEETNQNPSQFTAKVPTYPLLRQNVACPNQAKPKVMKRAYETLPEAFRETTAQSRIDGLRLTLDQAWLLVRPSGTEPQIRITVEAITGKRAESIMRETMKLVKKLIKEIDR